MAPDNVRRAADGLQKILIKLGTKCKLVETGNMHICLSFLGEVEDSEIKNIEQKLDTVAAKYNKFDARVGKVKFVPSENYIRVVVLDVSDPSNNLDKMRMDVANVVGGDSKPAHLTLCRVKQIDDKKRFASEFGNLECGEIFPINCIQLIKSDLSRAGPVYTVLHESKLS